MSLWDKIINIGVGLGIDVTHTAHFDTENGRPHIRDLDDLVGGKDVPTDGINALCRAAGDNLECSSTIHKDGDTTTATIRIDGDSKSFEVTFEVDKQGETDSGAFTKIVEIDGDVRTEITPTSDSITDYTISNIAAGYDGFKVHIEQYVGDEKVAERDVDSPSNFVGSSAIFDEEGKLLQIETQDIEGEDTKITKIQEFGSDGEETRSTVITEHYTRLFGTEVTTDTHYIENGIEITRHEEGHTITETRVGQTQDGREVNVTITETIEYNEDKPYELEVHRVTEDKANQTVTTETITRVTRYDDDYDSVTARTVEHKDTGITEVYENGYWGLQVDRTIETSVSPDGNSGTEIIRHVPTHGDERTEVHWSVDGDTRTEVVETYERNGEMSSSIETVTSPDGKTITETDYRTQEITITHPDGTVDRIIPTEDGEVREERTVDGENGFKDVYVKSEDGTYVLEKSERYGEHGENYVTERITYDENGDVEKTEKIKGISYMRTEDGPWCIWTSEVRDANGELIETRKHQMEYECTGLDSYSVYSTTRVIEDGDIRKTVVETDGSIDTTVERRIDGEYIVIDREIEHKPNYDDNGRIERITTTYDDGEVTRRYEVTTTEKDGNITHSERFEKDIDGETYKLTKTEISADGRTVETWEHEHREANGPRTFDETRIDDEKSIITREYDRDSSGREYVSTQITYVDYSRGTGFEGTDKKEIIVEKFDSNGDIVSTTEYRDIHSYDSEDGNQRNIIAYETSHDGDTATSIYVSKDVYSGHETVRVTETMQEGNSVTRITYEVHGDKMQITDKTEMMRDKDGQLHVISVEKFKEDGIGGYEVRHYDAYTERDTTHIDREEARGAGIVVETPEEVKEKISEMEEKVREIHGDTPIDTEMLERIVDAEIMDRKSDGGDPPGVPPGGGDGSDGGDGRGGSGAEIPPDDGASRVSVAIVETEHTDTDNGDGVTDQSNIKETDTDETTTPLDTDQVDNDNEEPLPIEVISDDDDYTEDGNPN